MLLRRPVRHRGYAVGSPDRGRRRRQATAPPPGTTSVLTNGPYFWFIRQMPSVPAEALLRDEVPDYDLPERVVADQPHQLKALGDAARMAILDLVLSQAASVTELATALGKPKSSVAHHVDVLRRAACSGW